MKDMDRWRPGTADYRPGASSLVALDTKHTHRPCDVLEFLNTKISEAFTYFP
jgi:hypothetical protein